MYDDTIMSMNMNRSPGSLSRAASFEKELRGMWIELFGS